MAVLTSRTPVMIVAVTHASALVIAIAIAIAVLASGCYSPDIADCQVTCSSDDDCAGDQRCAGGLCTGGMTCNAARADAGAAAVDSGTARTVTVRLYVIGVGTLTITGGGECVDDSCTLTVPAGELEIRALASSSERPFERWSSLKCAGQGATCRDVFLTDTYVAARFADDD